MPSFRRKSSVNSVNSSSSRGSSMAYDLNAASNFNVTSNATSKIANIHSFYDISPVSHVIHNKSIRFEDSEINSFSNRNSNSYLLCTVREFAPMFGQPSLVQSVLIEKSEVAKFAYEKLQAAICIQATFRMYVQRKCFVEYRKHIIKLQSCIRGWLARQGVVKNYKEEQYDRYVEEVFDYYATRIQACWRGYFIRHRDKNTIDQDNTNITNYYGLKTYLQNAVNANNAVNELSNQVNAVNEAEQAAARQKRENALLTAATSRLHFALSTESIKGVYNVNVIGHSLLRTSVHSSTSSNNDGNDICNEGSSYYLTTNNVEEHKVADNITSHNVNINEMSNKANADESDRHDIEHVIKTNAKERWAREYTVTNLSDSATKPTGNSVITKNGRSYIKTDTNYINTNNKNVIANNVKVNDLLYKSPAAITTSTTTTTNNNKQAVNTEIKSNLENEMQNKYINSNKEAGDKRKVKLPYINIKHLPFTPEWNNTASSSFAKTFSSKAHDCIPYTATSLTYSEVHSAHSYVSPSTEKAVDKQLIEQLHGRGNVFKISKTVSY